MNDKRVDGLGCLLRLFDNNQTNLIEYIVRNSYFIPVDVVKRQAEKMLEDIEKQTPLLVRVKSIKKGGAERIFYKRVGEKTYDLKMTESELRKFTNNEDNFVYHQDSGIRVKFDSTGNEKISNDVEALMSHKIGHTDEHSIVNYEITHLWNRTEHPLFFSSLWNVVLIPFVFARLTDKKSLEVGQKLLSLLKDISITLYGPEELLHRELDLIEPDDSIHAWARKLIDEEAINYLPSNK